MTRFRLVLASILVFALVAAVASRADRGNATESSGTIPARSFEFTYQVHVPANADPAGPTHLWIPLPQADAYQDIQSLHIGTPVSYSQCRHSEYGNVFAAFAPTAQQSATGFHVLLRFTAVRPEHKAS